MQGKKQAGRQMTFSSRLVINFFISTLIPFILITLFTANLYNRKYRADTMTLVDSSLAALSQNISVYLTELEYLSLTPYYNDDFFLYLNDSGGRVPYQQKENIRRSLDYMMSFLRHSRSDIRSIAIVTQQDCLYYTTGLVTSDVRESYPFGREPWYRQAWETRGETVFVPPHTPAYFQPAGDAPVFSIARAVVHIITRKPVAVIKVDADLSTFQDILSGVNLHVDSQVLVVSPDGALVCSRNGLEEEIRGILPEIAGGQTVLLNGRRWLPVSRQVQSHGWTVYILLDRGELQGNVTYIYFIACTLYLAGVLAAFFSYKALSRQLVRSIASIGQMLEQVQQGDFSARSPVREGEVLASLAGAVNRMALRLDETIKQEYLAEISRQNAEFKALQMQIQPHFLFNTLNSFIALSQIGAMDKLEQALFSLTRMMRYVLDRRETVGLDEELQFAEDYLLLQQLRFHKRLAYRIETPPEAGPFPLPRLLLQPFLENAVIHGIEPSKTPCTLVIAVEREGEAGLAVTIRDDGCGFALGGRGAGMGIGIKNTVERLRYFDPDSRVEIDSAPGQGCRVSLHITKGGAP